MDNREVEDNKIEIIFHVHLPKHIKEFGYPIVLGNTEELGSWSKPIIKFQQPFPQNPTYWQSDLVTISLTNFNKINYIQYKYAINLFECHENEKNVFEGNSNQNNRILDISRTDQFDIWINNNLSERYCIHHNNIKDFAFVDYIYNTIKENNFKDKVKEYQHLLTQHKELTVWALSPRFIINHMEDKLKEKRLFLCLLLGYYIQNYGHYELLTSFLVSEHFLEALENYKQETLPLGNREEMNTAIITLVQHNAFQMKFDWLIIFTIAAEVDPNYTFVEHLRALKYPNEYLLATFIKEVENIKPYIGCIKFKTYVKLGKVNLNIIIKLFSEIY
jgi:hypothetical protein